MVSVSSTTVKSMKEVLWRERQPLGAINTLIRDLKNGLKVQKAIAQKDFLQVCIRKAVFPKDILALSKSLIRSNIKKKYEKEARKILKDRIGEKVRDIRIAKET